MIATIEQVQRGVSAFVENEIGRRSIGLMKFSVYFMLPALPKIILNKLQSLLTLPGFDDIFDSAGNVQLDAAYARAKEAMNKIGKLELSQYHITMESADLDTLYNYIKNA